MGWEVGDFTVAIEGESRVRKSRKLNNVVGGSFEACGFSVKSNKGRGGLRVRVSENWLRRKREF
jgi:hypothetical protein